MKVIIFSIDNDFPLCYWVLGMKMGFLKFKGNFDV